MILLSEMILKTAQSLVSLSMISHSNERWVNEYLYDIQTSGTIKNMLGRWYSSASIYEVISMNLKSLYDDIMII